MTKIIEYSGVKFRVSFCYPKNIKDTKYPCRALVTPLDENERKITKRQLCGKDSDEPVNRFVSGLDPEDIEQNHIPDVVNQLLGLMQQRGLYTLSDCGKLSQETDLAVIAKAVKDTFFEKYSAKYKWAQSTCYKYRQQYDYMTEALQGIDYRTLTPDTESLIQENICRAALLDTRKDNEWVPGLTPPASAKTRLYLFYRLLELLRNTEDYDIALTPSRYQGKTSRKKLLLARTDHARNLPNDLLQKLCKKDVLDGQIGILADTGLRINEYGGLLFCSIGYTDGSQGRMYFIRVSGQLSRQNTRTEYPKTDPSYRLIPISQELGEQLIAERENLEATVVATVTASPRLVMRWNGKTIVNVSREFLNSNGAEKHITVAPAPAKDYARTVTGAFADNYKKLAGDLNVCSKRGLSERFDSTIGAGTVLMPFGGRYQQTPPQAMVHLVSVEHGHTDTVSYMAWGGNPYITEKSPYHGAYLAVVESVSKLVATGASLDDTYLTFQEYFLKPGHDPKRWGQPLAALLGAFKAQTELGIAAIGGKDSMSGTFEHIDVPPTLVSFAVTTGRADEVASSEFKGAGHKVVLLTPDYDENGLPVTASLMSIYARVTALLRSGRALSAYTPTYGGVAEGVMKMCFGNMVGFRYADGVSMDDIFGYRYGAFLLELSEDASAVGTVLGETTAINAIAMGEDRLLLSELLAIYENKLEPVYTCNIPTPAGSVENYTFRTRSALASEVKFAKPRVLIPVFPGTNCEYDTAKAFADAGAQPEIFIVRNRTAEEVARSAREFAEKIGESQIVFIPGGFSGGDEPDGSGKFITAFFRGERVKDEVTRLLEERAGLMGGICNGFQALIKLGLVPFGRIIETNADCPTLTYNNIGRHQSRIVRVRVASVQSPWLSLVDAGEVFSVPISHGEGKFVASPALIAQLAENGQIMTQYVDLSDNATMDVHFNPNGSAAAIEGILSPDGRVFGKMGHSERKGDGLYKNVPGAYDMKLFESAVRYFK